MFGKKNSKKKVIAYLHTHWDREWYREFEVFRLRLVRVFDNVLNLLTEEKIPSFYFDGQVAALLDYLEVRPEKEDLIRDLISNKRLYIGPFYCLIDEFLTDRNCFRIQINFQFTNVQNRTRMSLRTTNNSFDSGNQFRTIKRLC